MSRFAGEQESRLDRELVGRYVAEVGREPGRLAPDHPDAWQWEYRGSKLQRAELLARMEMCALSPAPAEQGALFGADAQGHARGCEMLEPVGQEGC